jgi:hypothetical protein
VINEAFDEAAVTAVATAVGNFQDFWLQIHTYRHLTIF